MKGKLNIKNLLTKINITNMTKVSVFGQQPTETKELKKIKFVKYFDNSGELKKSVRSQRPSEWHNVQLFDKSKIGQLDIIIAWDDNSEARVVFLGHWNDGVV